MIDDNDLIDDALAFEQWKDGEWKAWIARHGTAVGFPEHLHRLIEADPEKKRMLTSIWKLHSPNRQLQ